MIEATGIIVQDVNGKVLVLKRNDSVPEGNTLGLPGGRVFKGQKPIDVALQKTITETGLRFNEDDLKKLNTFSYAANGAQITFYVYVMSIQDSEPEIDLNKDGHSDYFWLDPQSLVLRNDLMKGMYPIFKFFNQRDRRVK